MNTHSNKFFTNKECKYYPCHSNEDGSPMEDINCLFCYCPLYLMDCPGDYTITSTGLKDCSNCILPHEAENYDLILNIFSSKFLMTQLPECNDPRCSSNNSESDYLCDRCTNNLINTMSSEELYELYANSSELLKDSPEAVDEFIKRLPDGKTRDSLMKGSLEKRTEVVTKFWFESINSILLERESG